MTQEKVLSVYLGANLKRKWQAVCTARGIASSTAMRQVVVKLTSNVGGSPMDFQTVEERPDPDRRRVELRLTKSEYSCIEQVAAASGMSPNAWIINLIRANIAHSPQFGMLELQALGKSNSRLLAIGRNLNQIARWMNSNHGSAPPDPERIEELYRHIVTHTESVTKIMRANLDRWLLK